MALLTTSPTNWRKDAFHQRSATTSAITPTYSNPRSSHNFPHKDSGEPERYARDVPHSFHVGPGLQRSSSKLVRSGSHRHSSSASGTFAPRFIKAEASPEKVDRIEGENDFSGRRFVWIKDEEKAFIQAWIVEERDGDQLVVQCENGNVCPRPISCCNAAINIHSSVAKLSFTTSTRSIQPSSTKPMT